MGLASVLTFLLVAFSYVAWSGHQNAAKLEACTKNLLAIATALELRAAKHQGQMPPDLATLVKEGYLTEIPCCPSVTRETYSKGFASNKERDGRVFRYWVGCHGPHHEGFRPGYPAVHDRDQIEMLSD